MAQRLYHILRYNNQLFDSLICKMDSALSPNSFTGRKTRSPPSSAKTANDVTEKIKELYMVMPKEIFDENTELSIPGKTKSKGPAEKIPNKGKILCEAVNYISSLQNNVDTVNRKEVEMKNMLRDLFHQMDEKNIDYSDIIQSFASKDSNFLSSLKSNSTTAEVLLYELMDIGPLSNDAGNNNGSSGSEVPQSATPQMGNAYSTTGSSSAHNDHLKLNHFDSNS